jgi:hypothetical protein
MFAQALADEAPVEATKRGDKNDLTRAKPARIVQSRSRAIINRRTRSRTAVTIEAT